MTPESEIFSNVSRETIHDLERYQELLLAWTKTINLIAPSTADDVWTRHIADSAQLYKLIPNGSQSVTDIGSGAGLPGIVLAIIDKFRDQKLQFTLIESDQRKAAFLRTVSRKLKLSITVLPARIEAVDLQRADVLTARALAPLQTLLLFGNSLLHSEGTALFLKGRTYQNELALAQQTWNFQYKLHHSGTDPDSRILEIRDIKRGQ
ncbi:16S rRNA m(7)G-527 methyltransferase [Loktanella atrilutea]|uniref:Ribosomal RNA small subunit methyltransferase G n=1 Tax=Loktanella atrilutea TaxID=366533 RepID=A0A1M4YPP5_LOKAT|nr:16S rRNA (guanine(527)-N(7))-methyltransferase RsmG [Loktanella atrilutea]SHF07785.1 16S rRNA m(7)G-527 methyltransferase [Loktanella atrilutea]